MTMPRWLLQIFTVMMLLMQTCTTKPAIADVYLDLAGGFTQFIPTWQDGDFHQDGLPHRYDSQAFAWRAGIGYRLNERWSVQAHYLNFGTTRVFVEFVDDRDYDPKVHQCLRNCQRTGQLTASDAVQGGEVSVSHHWPFDAWAPFVRLGGALLFHRFSIENYNGTFAQKHYGRIPTALIGGGVCYKVLCAETTYYAGFGSPNGGCVAQSEESGCGYPISKQLIMSLISLRIPL